MIINNNNINTINAKAAAMSRVPGRVGQQSLSRSVVTLHQQSSNRSDKLMLHGQGNKPLCDFPLL